MYEKNKPKYIQSLYDNKELSISDYPVNETKFSRIKYIGSACTEIFKNRWDFEFDNNFKNIKGIIIYFPEFIIRNKDNKEHNIKDLFVKLKLDSSARVTNIQGYRSTLTYAEYSSNYVHSHLSTHYKENTNTFSEFCLGTGSINKTLSLYNTDLNRDTFLNLLLELYPLVTYESLEGTPYRKIEDIHCKYVDTISKYWLYNDNKRDIYINSVKVNNKNIVLNFNRDPETQQFKIIEDNLFEELCKKDIPDSLLCVQIEGNYCNSNYVSNSFSLYPVIDKYTFEFLGKDIKFKVIDFPDNNVDPIVLEKIVHPELKNKLKQHIEQKVNENIIRQSIRERYENKTSST